MMCVYVCMCAHACVCHSTCVEVKKQLVEISSLLLLCGSQESNSGQAGLAASLLAHWAITASYTYSGCRDEQRPVKQSDPERVTRMHGMKTRVKTWALCCTLTVHINNGDIWELSLLRHVYSVSLNDSMLWHGMLSWQHFIRTWELSEFLLVC